MKNPPDPRTGLGTRRGVIVAWVICVVTGFIPAWGAEHWGWQYPDWLEIACVTYVMGATITAVKVLIGKRTNNPQSPGSPPPGSQ